MAYPVTLNGRTYTLADFEGTNYVEGLPDAFQDFVTHAGDIYNSTSTTSNSIGTGSKTFTVESAKPYQAGTPLRIADAAAPSTNFMDTIVTSYSGTTLVVDSVGYAGSGTYTSWNVNIGGAASVAGTVAIAQGGTGATTAAAARTNLDVYSKSEADGRYLNISGDTADISFGANMTFGDNNKAIFGAGSDLQIYHDGSHSRIADAGTGDLKIGTSGGAVRITANGVTDDMIVANQGGTVTLSHSGSTKLTTTSTGVDITGTAVTDGVTVAGNLSVDGGTIKLDGNYPVGTQNVALGDGAADALTSGNYNVAVGHNAAGSLTSGSSSAMIGNAAGAATTTGGANVAVGDIALTSNTTGANNLAIGYASLLSNTTASNNTAVGYQAGYNLTTSTTSDNNTMIGGLAGYSANFAINNTYVGYGSGYLMTSGDANTIIGRYNGNQGGLDIRTSSNNIVLSDGDGNPRIVVNSSGHVGIAATNPTQALQVGEDPFGTYTQGFTSQDGLQRSSADSTASRAHYQFRNPNGLVGDIVTSGSSTIYATSSDYRLKENVVELTGATDRLKQIPVHRFNFIADPDRTVDGFLAHEVQTVVPEAVHGTKDEVDADGNPVYQGIDQSKLVPLLVATIKELEARITALENP